MQNKQQRHIISQLIRLAKRKKVKKLNIKPEIINNFKGMK